MSNFSANIQAILDTSKFNKQIKELESKEYSINRFKLNTKGLPSQIQASLDGHNFTINITGIKTSNIESQMKSAGNKAGQSFSQSLVSRINSQISSGGIDAAVARVQQKFDTLKATINSMGSGSNQTALQNKLIAIGSELGHLKVLQDEFLRGGLAGTSLIDKYSDFQSTLSRVKNGLTEATSETKRFAKATDVVALQNKMESWLNKNTRATKTYGNTVQGFISKLQSLSAQGNVSSADLNELSDAFRRVDQAAESAGLKGKSFGSSIKGAFQSITRYIGVSTLIYAAFNAVKNGIKEIVDLDTALVDLQKTTDANEAQLREFYYTANETAKALGSTTKEVIQAAADWSRLGYSIKDAQTMAETSSIFASISPGMDISTATDGLVSAMKAFDIEAEDALDGIASKINAIGNTQAVDNQDIVNVLTRSSAAMKEANNTLEETIALGTAATEITRDAEAVGTALKTMSMRIRGYDEETEEYVGGIEELSGEIADLTKTASKPGGISLFTDDSKTEFKSTTQLLRDISEIYDELTDKQQADLLEKLAGKRQGQVVAAILSNFGAVEKSLATMADSAGGAMREMEIIEESLEFKLNALKETATGVFQNLFAKEDMIVVIELLTKLMEVLDFLTEKLGLFGTALTGIAIYAFVKNFDQLIALGLQGAVSVELVTVATAKMTAAQAAAVLVKTNLAKAQQIEILMNKGLTKEEAEATLATAAHTAATAAGTAATGLFSGALTMAKVAVKGLTAALKSNPYILLIGAVIGLVAAFNSLSTAAIDASEKSKEAAQQAMEVTAKLDEEAERVDELIEKYKELKDTEYVDADTREQIRDIQKEINKLVGGETEGLDLVNGKLDDQLAKLKQIQLEKAKEDSASYIAAYSSSQKSSDDAYIRDKSDVGGLSFLADWWGYDLYVKGWDADVETILESVDGVNDVYKDWNFGTYTDIQFDADGAQEYYDIIQKCIKALENNTSFYHQDSDVYNKLVKMRDDYKEFLDTVDEATASLIENAVTIEGLELDIDGKVVDSAESYAAYRDALIQNVLSNENLAQAKADGKATHDTVGLLVDDYMADAFSQYYTDYQKYEQQQQKIRTVEGEFVTNITTPEWLAAIKEKVGTLSDEELEVALDLVATGDYRRWSYDEFLESWDKFYGDIQDRLNKETQIETEPYDYYNYKQAEKNYSEHLERLKKAKLSAEKYGNVDLNNLWYFSDTDGGVKGYHGNYGSMASNGYQNFVNFNTWGETNPGFASSAFAMYDEYGGIKLSVTPYFWAEGHSQPEVLTKDTVHNYIDKLIEEAGDGYTYDDLLRLDAEGIEVDGMHIKGIIADIGDTAEATTEKLRAYSTADAGIMVARQRLYAAMSKTYKEDLSTLWNSEDFEETKASLVAMAKTVNGITPDAIKDLADESADLAEYLDQDGMSAEFLANILQTEALGGDGFALITENALELNTALEGMTRRFDEVTDAKARYDAALSAGEKDDNFKSYAEAFEALNNEFKEGTVNSNQFWAAAEFIFGADQLQEWGWSDGIDQIYAAMQKNVGVFEDAESAGAGFLDQLYKIAEGGQVIGEDGSVIAEIEKFADGSYEFNVDALYLDELAEKMGLSKEAVLACLEALSMWGDVDYYDMDEVLTAIKDIGLSSDDFEGTAVNVSALTDQLLTLGYTNKEIYELLDSLQEIEGIELLNVDSDVNVLTESLKNLGIATGEVGEVKINADGLLNLMQSLQYTKEDAQELINKLGEADGITLTNSTGEVQNVDDVLADIETRTFATVESELSTVSSEINNANDAADTLYSKLQMIDGTTVTVSVKLDVKSSILKSLGLQGFAKGTKNAPDGAALVGEEGEELVKSGDRAYLVGTHGAEIVDLNPGDTVYTAEETKRIKRSARGIHGIMPAYSGGYTGGSGGRINTGKTYEDLLPDSGKSSSSNNKSSSDDDKIDTFDWIEVAIDRIERVIDRLKKTAESTYKSLKSKLGAAADEISMVNQEIAMQQKAFNRYMQEANSVGLSEGLKEKVRTGTIDINEYDEDTQKLIKDYQDWYEKALDCEDAIDDLHESLASLYEDNFNNVKDDFENQLELVEHMANQYETGIDMLEARGYLESTKYYSALQDATKGEIAIMNKELAGLEQAFSDAMNSGEIEKYSEAWYAMQAEINGVKEEIAEANVELAEYAKTMREIEWGYFDYTQERISQLTQEADFLIDLMSNSDLHTDKGQLTDEGMATMGLHGQNYNTYMAQADMYAQEILEIDKELAKDPYNTELIERREELLGLQQDSILAAEDEKQAIVALVEEGINLELQAMQDLIDKYTESLDTAKDLYEYQKKIKEQAANVASLQKQLSAYENDLTEETRAKVQKLTVELAKAEEELAESEYEQYISDQKKLLDELYLEYETILNQRLDNVDALIGDMITAVNDNSGSINETLTTTADNVGYTMTTNMQNIWNGATNALDGTISKYGDDFSTKFTAVQSVLSSIQANTAAMVAASDEEAQETVDTTNPETTPSAPTTPTTPPATQPTTPSTPEKTITVGGKINAKGAKIYDYAGDTSGENQYFSKDPIYKVLDEKNGYLKVRHHKLSSGVTGWFKKSDVKAYKTGGLVDYTGLAKVDGTPGKPELMLNAEDTKNFLELRDLLRVLSSQSLTVGSSGFGSPTLSGVSDLSRMLSTLRTANGGTFGTTIGDVEITIPIERVDDYNDFVTKLRNDPKFENMLLDVTIGRLAGGSSLAKNKYKW